MMPGGVLSSTLPGVSDLFGLQRFLDAQDLDGIYDQALRELRAGRKHSHWMWFVFPQVKGLGNSPMAQHYAISGLAEARAYLAHPLLGHRLIECARALTALQETDAVRVFGPAASLSSVFGDDLFVSGADFCTAALALSDATNVDLGSVLIAATSAGDLMPVSQPTNIMSEVIATIGSQII